jgi:tetratricopeptide (TPR) repeat protein
VSGAVAALQATARPPRASPSAFTLWWLANCALRQGQLDRAGALLARAQSLRPNEYRILAAQAALAERMGELEKALRLYRRAARLAPCSAIVQVNLGVALSRAGQLEAALAAFDRARALQPDDPGLAVNRGGVLAGLGRLELARAELEAAARSGSAQPGLWRNLGVVYERTGRAAAAIDAFAHELQFNPLDLRARERLGRLQLRAGRVSTGRRELALVEQLRHASSEPSDR